MTYPNLDSANNNLRVIEECKADIHKLMESLRAKSFMLHDIFENSRGDFLAKITDFELNVTALFDDMVDSISCEADGIVRKSEELEQEKYGRGYP